MRVLLDEMIGPRVAEALREAGVDAVGVVERTDLRGLADEAVLQFATEDGRVIVTRNIADFARLDQQWLAQGRQHRGLLMVSEQAFPQNRNLVGALTRALLHAEQHGSWPPPGEVRYLRSAVRAD